MTVSVKMMKVMRWPLRSGSYRKFRVGLTLHGLDKLPAQLVGDESARFLADVKWKGPKRSLGPRFRSVKRERSSEVGATIDGGLELEQEFECECTLALSKEGFYPWDVSVVIRKVSRIGSKAKVSVLGSGNVNLGEVAPLTGNVRQRTKVPILVDETEATLSITLDFEELCPQGVEASSVPCISLVAWERDDIQGTGVTGLRPLTSILTGLSKKSRVEDGRGTSDESSQESPDRFESDSVGNEDSDVAEEEEVPSFCYGSIAGANMWSSDRFGSNEDALVFAVPRLVEETSSSDSDQTSSQSSVRRILSWRKRKMSFRSPRARGEPLLNKAYGDNGGDEIDWDRRQSESPEDALENMRLKNERKSKTDAWDFGETFQVGRWEHKELTSRDGHLKLSTNVFFASIDQRSESAAGESACTALVVVLADWLHSHSRYMPSRAELDSLIREGSAEWRKLCRDATFKDRFPDGHFDLETILEAAVRPLSVNQGKSFVGFFQPDGLGDSNDFLEGAMSFDSIWDEVERSGPAIYIVSWNDHFFVLKVEEQCVYIIDTLGERLYEGCDQAYLLKFDSQTVLTTVPAKEAEQAKEQKDEAQKESSKEQKEQPQQVQGKDQQAKEQQNKDVNEDSENGQEKEQENDESTEGSESGVERQEQLSGRNACKEFVKGFFAAIPLRQLQSDLKKGFVGKDYIHRRLQIEFHFTESQHTAVKAVCNGC